MRGWRRTKRVQAICDGACERAQEHLRHAESGKGESHMVEHQVESHEGDETPMFNFKVVKKCKSSLERQLREAVRIQMTAMFSIRRGCTTGASSQDWW